MKARYCVHSPLQDGQGGLAEAPPTYPMPEESLSPEAQDEPPSASVEARSPQQEDKPQAREKKRPDGKKDDSSDSESPEKSGKRPVGKSNVRGSKKTATKKGAKPQENNKTDKEAQADDSKSPRRGRGRQGKSPAAGAHIKLDDQQVAKRAWKIFLGEVGEEGLALITDNDARELARRSLKIAELYSREEAALYQNAKGNKQD